MKLKLVISDESYCKMLADMIARLDRNVYVEIGRNFEYEENTLIVTDFSVHYFDEKDVEIGKYIVFLDENEIFKDVNLDVTPFILFKYMRVSELLTYINFRYHLLFQNERRMFPGIKEIGVISLSEGIKSSEFVQKLAKAIMYATDEEILVIPLSHFNFHGEKSLLDYNIFLKFIYCVEKGRNMPVEIFLREDSFGINYFILPYGRNPFSYIGSEMLKKSLIMICSGQKNVLMFDIGNDLSERNVEILKELDYMFVLHDGFEHEKVRDVLSTFGVNCKEDTLLVTVDMRGSSDSCDMFIDTWVKESYR